MHIENYLFLYIVKSTSVDDDRASISLKAVNEYIDAVLNALKQVTDLRLLLNMDESGFGRRPEYKKRRSCVYCKNCKVPPLWRADTDNYHISWVCCINAACSWTRHMIITTRQYYEPGFQSNFCKYICRIWDIFERLFGHRKYDRLGPKYPHSTRYSN